MGIDGPEDITPENLRKEAFDARYGGRAHLANVLVWTAVYLERLERKYERLKEIRAGGR